MGVPSLCKLLEDAVDGVLHVEDARISLVVRFTLVKAGILARL